MLSLLYRKENLKIELIVPENARIQEYRQQRLTTPEVKPFWLDQKLKKFLRKNIANNALANLKHLEILIIVLLNVEI